MTCRGHVRAAPRPPPQRRSSPPSRTSVVASLYRLRRLFYALHQKSSRAHSAAPPFRKKSRSARLLGCKRPRCGSLSLTTFCGAQVRPVSLLTPFRFEYRDLNGRAPETPKSSDFGAFLISLKSTNAAKSAALDFTGKRQIIGALLIAYIEERIMPPGKALTFPGFPCRIYLTLTQ